MTEEVKSAGTDVCVAKTYMTMLPQMCSTQLNTELVHLEQY